MFKHTGRGHVTRHSLELPQPGVSHDGPQDGRQVAEGHKGMVDGGGQVVVPAQEVPEVKHQHGWGGGNTPMLVTQHGLYTQE